MLMALMKTAWRFSVHILPHQNKKALRHTVSCIHFLRKIFFMIKWTSGFFILMWRFQVMLAICQE